jgi:hypothetical protein
MSRIVRSETVQFLRKQIDELTQVVTVLTYVKCLIEVIFKIKFSYGIIIYSIQNTQQTQQQTSLSLFAYLYIVSELSSLNLSFGSLFISFDMEILNSVHFALRVV